MADLIVMYAERRELINAAFARGAWKIVCPECNGDSALLSFTRRTPDGYLIFDEHAMRAHCKTCGDKGTIVATEKHVSAEAKEKIIAWYKKSLLRQQRSAKTAKQSWNRNNIKREPKFKR